VLPKKIIKGESKDNIAADLWKKRTGFTFAAVSGSVWTLKD